MNRIAEFYESNHLLIFIVLIISFGIYIKYTQYRNRYIVSSENKTVEEEEIEDKKITTWSTIELKYILTSEVVNFRISENQSNKYKNKLEIRRLHYKNPLAVSLLEKTTGDIIKYKIDELDENYIYVEVLNVNNNLFTDEEIAMYENNEQIKKVNVELEKPKQVMKPQFFEYTSTRLTFKKVIIDEMKDNDILTINVLGAQNPDNNGIFKMTKRQIYQNFNNVIVSVAYIRDGNYNCKTNPPQAQQFRVN